MHNTIEYGKRRTAIMTVIATLSFVILLVLFIIPNGIAPNIVGLNYKNVTVWTHVNITNAKPEVLNVTVYPSDVNFSTQNVTLYAGDYRRIYCNATVRDWDGFNDIVYVNGTLWHSADAINDDPDDNNTHYTNVTCTLNGSISSYIGWYVCAFDVLYYANNGTWNCNVSVQDVANKTGWRLNTTTIYPLYSLNVTDGIDYGNVAVEETTGDINANITNLGNMAINVTVQGYGSSLWDGLAMNCSINGNITVENERFALTSGVAYGAKTPLTGLTPTAMPNLTMPKQTLPDTYIVNETYWQLYVPPNPAGNCTGYIVFTALAP